MKESKAIYVTKRDIRYESSKEYHLYDNKVGQNRALTPDQVRYGQTREVSCQYDCKRDNLICTCGNLATIKKRQEREIRYFGLPKQIYAYHGTRSFTDIGVGSVKALQRKKVKRIYLPETDDRGVGSSDLSSYVIRRSRQQRVSSYYEQKRTSSKCVGGILEYNTGCVMNEKLSPIVLTVSGSTSPRDSTYNRNIEIGSNTVVKSLTNTTTQVEREEPKKEEVKPEIKVEEIKPILIVKEEIKEMKNKTLDVIKPSVQKEKEDEKEFSSDSLVQHVHNLEDPSDYKQSRSRLSMVPTDPMENRLEREYRRIFANKSKETKSSNERSMADFKSTSTLKRRFEALRRGLAKKEDSKKNAVIVQDVSNPTSVASRKDVSINSDPPSLEGRSYSNTKPYCPFPSVYSRDKSVYNPRISSHYRRSVTGKKERDSAQWSSRPDEEDSECQGVKGMFKLWGKKFNLEEDYYKKNPHPTPKPSYDPPKEHKKSERKIEEPKLVIKDDIEEKKDGKRFFFFKKKNKYKEKPYKAKKGVTTGRCEVRDGLMIKIGAGGTSYVPEDVVKEPEKVPDDYEDLIRKAWLTKFMSRAIESRNSVKVRWNNKTYATSSSTVFELMDNVYKDAGVILRSKSQITVHSSYKSYTTQHVNFVHQNIEAWMIPKTMTDKPKLLPKMKCKSNEDRKDNIEVRISDQKWFIDKSKAFSHKIEVVLHSNNMVKLNKEESSEYLRIDIPKGFFLDSSSDDNNKQSSDEEVYKIVEYETGSDLKKDNKTVRNFDIGDHKQNNIKVTVSVKESKDYGSQYLDTVIRQPVYKNVSFQGSNVFILKRCDVIGVGIITQRDLREKHKPILKIQDDYSDEESDHHALKTNTTKCELAESYLQDFYRHCTPLGIDSYSWCVSDSHLKCCSENSRASYNNQGDVTKSCPNIYDDFQTATILSSCGASSCSHCHVFDQDSAKPPDKCCKWFGKFKKKKEGPPGSPDKRTLPKDSIEVFKRRKIYAASDKSKWSCPSYGINPQNPPCPGPPPPCPGQPPPCPGQPPPCPGQPPPCPPPPCPAKPSCDSKGGTLIECPKIMKSCCRPIEPRAKKRVCKKHVSLPNCEAMNQMLAKRLSTGVPSGILAFKGSSGCDACKKKGYCPKHAKVNPKPSCEIPRAPCRDSCEKMKKPPCANSKTSCENPPPPSCPASCPSSKKSFCPPPPPPKKQTTPPNSRRSASCPPTPPKKKKPPSCPGSPPSRPQTPPCMKKPKSPPGGKKLPSCPSTPTRSKKKQQSCPNSPAPCKKPSCPSTPPCKRSASPPPRPTPPPSPPPCRRPPPPSRSPPPSPPPCRKTPPARSPPPSPPPCKRPPPCSSPPPSPPPCRRPPPCASPPPSPPPCRRPPPCASPPPSPPPCRRPPPCQSPPPSPPPCRRPPPCRSPPPSPPPCRRRPPSPSPPPSRKPSCPPSPQNKKPSCPPTPQPCKKTCPNSPKPPTPPPCMRPPRSPPSCPHIPSCPRPPPSCPHTPPCPPPPPPCPPPPPPCPPPPPSCPHTPPCPPPPPSCPHTPPCRPPPPPCPYSPACSSPPPCPYSPPRPPCPHASPPPPCPYASPPAPCPYASPPPPCPHASPPPPQPCPYASPPPKPPCYRPPPCRTPPCRTPPCRKPCPYSPPCTPPPRPKCCRTKAKPCPLSPPSCPASPPSCCSMDPDRCPAIPPPCKKASGGICKKISPLFFKKKSPPCPASPPCKPTPCKESFCKALACQPSPCEIHATKKTSPSPCQKFSTTSISYGSLKHRTQDAPYFYSPVHPCPPEDDRPKTKSRCNSPPCNKSNNSRQKPSSEGDRNPTDPLPFGRPPCDQCRTSNDEFPWPTKNQVSNQSSMTSIYQNNNQTQKEDFSFKCSKNCPMMPQPEMLKLNYGEPKKECKKSCPNHQGSPRPPCMPEMSCPPPRPLTPPSEPRRSPSCPGEASRCKSKSKMSGLFLKMKPGSGKKKSMCSKDCLAWESEPPEDGCISLNSEEKITIRLKKDSPSTDEIREGLNIKVQDEDGMTLFERKDYRLQHAGCSMQRPSVLGDMYKASEVRRVATTNSVPDLDENDRHKQLADAKSDASIANLIEIQFKLKVTQGEKTTEINIANDGDKENEEDEKIQIVEPADKNPQEIFVVKDGGEHQVAHPDPKNDINIRIVIKNFKPKSGKKKSVNLKHEDYGKDFAQKISAKFHTVSTGYSDVLHDDNVFSVHRATVDLTSSVDKSKTHSNKSEEIMSETLTLHGKGRSSICRCVMTDMSDSKIDYEDLKSIPSRKYSTNRETQEETDTDKPTHKYDTEETDSDKQTDHKYDTEETDQDKMPEPKYDTETDTEKHTAPKYDTFMSTDTDEQEPIPEEDTYIEKEKSIEVIIKPHTKDEKKEMLKHVFEKAHETKTKNKTRMRKLRDMLKVILTSDSSEHDESKSLRPNDLAKDVTYASLKPNYFRDSDSMNNYYRAESHTKLSSEINTQVMYPSAENNSDMNNSSNSNPSDVLSSENESTKACMCSTLAARLKLASRIGDGGGCCCGIKNITKKNEETTCDLKKESDYFQYEYKQSEYVDVETQNSNYLVSKINSTNLSTNKSIKSSITDDLETVKTDSGVVKAEQTVTPLKRTFSPILNKRRGELRKFNRNTILSISDDDKIVLLSSKPTRVSAECAKCKIKERKKKLKDPTPRIRASDILQSYETKKAVLEIYTEKTISNDGEHLVAKLPKFVYDRENEIQTNYEAIANADGTVCKRNIVMMAINR